MYVGQVLAGSVQSYLGGEQDGPAWMLLSLFTAFVPCSDPHFVLHHFNTAVQNQQVFRTEMSRVK